MLKAAVIGLGDISKIHLAAIQANPDVELTAVCDIDPAHRSMFPNVNFYNDYEVMIAEEVLDCVHICLPHYLHYPATKACVNKGINVFLEKPIALNHKEGYSLVKLEEEHKNVKICVCLQNRYNKTFEVLNEMIENGKYGPILGIKGLVTWNRPKAYYDVKPWRGKMAYAGGGVMINQSIHTLDIMQLLGGEIESIRGSIDQLLDYGIEVEDTASAHIQFSNGATGLFFATISNERNSSVELQVTFKDEKLTIKDSMLTRADDEDKKIELVTDDKLPGTKFYYGASHAKLINRFYRCIAADSDEYTHVKEALVSMKMIDAIRQSSEEKRRVRMEELNDEQCENWSSNVQFEK